MRHHLAKRPYRLRVRWQAVRAPLDLCPKALDPHPHSALPAVRVSIGVARREADYDRCAPGGNAE